MRRPDAVLFDLDGVIVDSTPAHAAAWTALFAEEGVAFGPADYEAVALGRSRDAVLREVLGDLAPDRMARLMARKVELVREWLDVHGLAPLPGTTAFLDALDAAGIPYAIATSSRTPELLLGAAGLLERFAVIVDRDDVEHGKPEPDLYLEAARRLGVDPARCWVVEDAPVGVEAGLAAGCRVIGLAAGGVDHGLSRAHRVVSRLDAEALLGAATPGREGAMRAGMTTKILVTGGAGYLGAVLVPKLLAKGYEVTVLDCLLFGSKPLEPVMAHPRFTLVEADIRDHDQVDAVLARGFDVVVHLAAISNDPSSDLDADLTTGVNLTAIEHLMPSAKKHGVKRFLYASSASVYGIKDTPDVTEDLELEPITLYAKYKAAGEQILAGLVDDAFCAVSVRAATVCGYSPRLRLDLTINILTSHALTRGAIRVFGGSQLRPNIHIEDLTDFYVTLVEAPRDLVQGQAFNVSAENASVMQLAEMIRDAIDPSLPIDVEPTNDNRSYHLSAAKLRETLGWAPKHSLGEAVSDLKAAFERGDVPNVDDAWYRNVVWMKQFPGFWRTGATL